MKILIDTNVFIEREGNWTIDEDLQDLENQLKTQGHDILIHPLSKQEVQQYGNEEGRKRAESKIATYAQLDFPKYPTSEDAEFRSEIDDTEDFNETVDNSLLYSVFNNRVDFLITEDRGIHEKAERLNIENQVLSITEGREHFEKEPSAFGGPPSIQKTTVGDLDVNDPIFDSLKEEYEDFIQWFDEHSDRDAYVNWQPDGTLGAVLILKPGETENIGDEPELGKKDRLKISTLKVAEGERGSKTGELLISIAIQEAIGHGLEEIYLTHRIRDTDHLVRLISQYGFRNASKKTNGETVFVKRLTPGPQDDPDPFEVTVRFYPSFYDGESVNKFLVPIQPNFHSKLFQTYEKRHPKLIEFGGQFYSEGNAIKKAYLSNANTKKLGPADVLLFYRSRDHMEVTDLGVCERVEYGITDPDGINQIVGRRSVFSEREIENIAESPTTVILFKWHFSLETPIHYRIMREEGVLKGPPQTIQTIDRQAYKFIRDKGGIDERFAIN